MKVLFHCQVPFAFAHGGAQIQIEQTQAALIRSGVEVEPLRWWDDRQTGDVLHYFGRIPIGLLELARKKGMKVVIADLLTQQGSRSGRRLALQRAANRFFSLLPPAFRRPFSWDSYREADACIALTAWEAHLMQYLFGAQAERTHVVPNGVEEVFLTVPRSTRGKWLVCTATITERKRVLELALSAAHAGTPLWVIGKPYNDDDPYAQRFMELARSRTEFVRYEGPVSDRSRMAQIYAEARGFVLLSTMESLSLSALESAACGCPLLLSDLPWARTVFKEAASYCRISATTAETAAALKQFYDAAPRMPVPAAPLSWDDVAGQLKKVYAALPKTSR